MIQQHSGLGEPRKEDMDNTYLPDMTPRREGGDDSLAEASPYDSRNDEKVLINEPRKNKTTDRPSGAGTDAREERTNKEGMQPPAS